MNLLRNTFSTLWLVFVVATSLAGAGAQAATFPLPPPHDDLIGAVRHVYVSGSETLLDIARRHNVGFEDVARANPGVDMWVPGDGMRITLQRATYCRLCRARGWCSTFRRCDFTISRSPPRARNLW